MAWQCPWEQVELELLSVLCELAGPV
jgi:hypothetical protein